MCIPIFPCQWVSVYKTHCHRAARGRSRYCSRHAMADRLVQFWEPREGLLEMLLMILPVMFFYYARSYFLWFRGGQNTQKAVEYNPQFAWLNLGLSLVFLGKAISNFRCLRPSRRFDRWMPYWSPAILLAGFGLAWLTGGDIGSDEWYNRFLGAASGLAFVWPAAAILHRLDRSTGAVAPLVVCGGLTCIFVGGLSVFVMEFVYQLTGRFDHLAQGVEHRGAHLALSLANSFSYCCVAVDAGVALCYTGYMITPFPSQQSPYYRLRLWAEPTPPAVPSLAANLFGLAVIIGQSNLLDFLLVMFIPVTQIVELLSLPAIVGLHYLVAHAPPSRPLPCWGENHIEGGY
jgi:hypothetical protein